MSQRLFLQQVYRHVRLAFPGVDDVARGISARNTESCVKSSARRRCDGRIAKFVPHPLARVTRQLQARRRGFVALRARIRFLVLRANDDKVAERILSPYGELGREVFHIKHVLLARPCLASFARLSALRAPPTLPALVHFVRR